MLVYNQNKTVTEAFEKIVAMSNEITKTVIFVSNLLSVDPSNLVLVDHKKLLGKVSDSSIDNFEPNSSQNNFKENSDRSVTSTTTSGTDKDGHKKAGKAANTIHKEQSEDEINSSTLDESSKEVLDKGDNEQTLANVTHEITKRNETMGLNKVFTIKREYLEDKPFLIKLEPEDYEPFTIKREVMEENVFNSKDLSAVESSIKSENAYTLSDNVSENMAYFNREAENFIKMTDSVLKNNNDTNATVRKKCLKSPDLLPQVHPDEHLHQDRIVSPSPISLVQLSPLPPILPPLSDSSDEPPSSSHNQDTKNNKTINSSLSPTTPTSSRNKNPLRDEPSLKIKSPTSTDKDPSSEGSSLTTKLVSPEKNPSRVGSSYSTTKTVTARTKVPSREESSSTIKPFTPPNKTTLRKVCSTTMKPSTSPDHAPSREGCSSIIKPYASSVGSSSKIKPSTSPEKSSSRVESFSTIKPSTSPERSSVRVGRSSSIKPSTSTDKASSRAGSSTMKPSASPEKAPSRVRSYLSSRRTIPTNNQFRRKHHSGNKRPLCNYNEKGLCFRGKLCQFYHDYDALVVPQYTHPQYPHGFYTASGDDKYKKRLRIQNGEWRKKSGKGEEKTLVKRSWIKNQVIQEDLEEEDLEELIRIKKEELLSLYDVDNDDSTNWYDTNGITGKEDSYEVEEGEIV